MKFLPTSDAERAAMLSAIGVRTIDDLFAAVPEAVRRAPDLPPPMSEIEIRRFIGGMASRNANARDTAFFLGAGLYNHYVSAIADQMLYRAEWLTSYTPYQPEVSQGTLQSIFEFQTHICLLTGLEVANASLYEGASALVEALLMAERLSRGKTRAVLSAGIHPEYRETVRTYFTNLGLESVEVPLGKDGATDAQALAAACDEKTFAVAVQSPNFYGVVEDWNVACAAAKAKGALSIAVVAEAISLALLAPPGEGGADIACGEAQSLGVPMHNGGPLLGFLACRGEHQRQIPGRLVGQTKDADGRRAFCLTLSTREQHIRREKATSNICTNQGLMALASNIHMSLLGKEGLREVALQCHAKGGIPQGRDREGAGLPDPPFGADLQRVRRGSVRGRGSAAVAIGGPEDPRRRCALALRRRGPAPLPGRGDRNERARGDGRPRRCPRGEGRMSVEVEEKAAPVRDPRRPEPRPLPLVFERSGEGKVGYSLPPLDVPAALAIPERLCRKEIAGGTQISEVDVARHFTRLSRLNFSIDQGLYALGSCTMKHNPRTNEEMARLPGFAASHPLAPEELCQGSLELAWRLERILAELTGLVRVTLQPSAGAQGELAGILMVRKALEKAGRARTTVLIPDSAHGTNPASEHFAGYKVRELKSNARGTIDLDVLEAAMTEDVAALMLTVPNTLGIFEDRILDIARIVHAKGGYLYCDGANFNAFVGVAKPGLMGVDVMHMNLHKTFSTPHGGGGPGSGPVAVGEALVPFLPRPTVERRADGTFFLDYDRPDSIGRLRTFLGNFGMFVRALSYICAYGNRIGEVARVAVLNANYIRAGLAGVYHLKYDAPSMHEVVLSDKKQVDLGVSNVDIAKRLMDYGFHPPTISFPLIVHGALMIEPTETEGKPVLDAFVSAMREIARECEENPDLVRTAPHTTPVKRVDEVGAARNLVLRWKP